MASLRIRSIRHNYLTSARCHPPRQVLTARHRRRLKVAAEGGRLERRRSHSRRAIMTFWACLSMRQQTISRRRIVSAYGMYTSLNVDVRDAPVQAGWQSSTIQTRIEMTLMPRSGSKRLQLRIRRCPTQNCAKSTTSSVRRTARLRVASSTPRSVLHSESIPTVS